jgi:hypothetical protein
MKTLIKYIRSIALATIILCVINNIANSQGTESRKKYTKGNKVYAGFVITPQSAGISNNDFPVSGALNQESGTSLGLALEGGYFFSEIAGISIGAGMGSYSSNLSLDSCSYKFPATDIENEAYEMRIKGKTITEDQKISFLSIPVCLAIRIPAGEKLGFFAKAGLSFNIPITKTYKGSGTFTYDGYYAAYPVLLKDIPIYFPSNNQTSTSGTLEVKSVSQSVIVSGGVTYALNESLQLSLGVLFNKSIGNISDSNSVSDYRLTSKPEEMNSIMAGSSNAGVQAVGLSLGVRYYLR